MRSRWNILDWIGAVIALDHSAPAPQARAESYIASWRASSAFTARSLDLAADAFGVVRCKRRVLEQVQAVLGPDSAAGTRLRAALIHEPRCLIARCSCRAPLAKASVDWTDRRVDVQHKIRGWVANIATGSERGPPKSNAHNACSPTRDIVTESTDATSSSRLVWSRGDRPLRTRAQELSWSCPRRQHKAAFRRLLSCSSSESRPIYRPRFEFGAER